MVRPIIVFITPIQAGEIINNNKNNYKNKSNSIKASFGIIMIVILILLSIHLQIIRVGKMIIK